MSKPVKTNPVPCRSTGLLLITLLVTSFWGPLCGLAQARSAQGIASWYGEHHRGKLMANGKPFDPDKMTAASWFYPLGTKVRVTAVAGGKRPRSVVVTITDRGPARRLVAEGRIIDLGLGPFSRLANPEIGLVRVRVERVKDSGRRSEMQN